MIHRIDQAVLWLFAAFSAFCLFMSIADGRLLIALPASFMAVFILRLLINRIPLKETLCRNERAQQTNALLKRWALIDEKQALSEIRALLPDLFEESAWPSIHLVQRLPDCDSLRTEQLLDLWREHRGGNSLNLLITGSVCPEVLSLYPTLQSPSVRLISAEQLRRRIIPLIHTVPQENIEKERRRPLSARVAPLIHSVQPVRSSAYIILFLILYLLTRSFFYLLSAAIFLMQLSLYFSIRGRQRN